MKISKNPCQYYPPKNVDLNKESYRRNIEVQIQVLAVVDVKITFLPVPAVVLNFVEFVIKMSGLKIIYGDQMSPVKCN